MLFMFGFQVGLRRMFKASCTCVT